MHQLLALALIAGMLVACGGKDAPGVVPDAPVATADASAGGSVTLDIPYDPSAPADPLRMLDVYRPAATDAPVVIWVHGGGWFTGDKGNSMADKVALFNGAGYVLVSINYRLSPVPVASPAADRIKHPTHPRDVALALAWVADHIDEYGGDRTRVALLGHSAGAHLAALVATDASYLDAHGLAPSNVDCVGSFDTEGYDIPAAMATATQQQAAILVNAFGDDPAAWEEASPITHAGPMAPDDFLLVARGGADRRAHVTAFRDALVADGVTVEVVEADGLSHEEVNDHIGAAGDTVMTPPIVAFLERCLR